MAFNDKDQGGSAFPSHGNMGEVVEQGMTLRDYIAIKAMQGYIASGQGKCKENVLKAVKVFYEFSDAMIAERNR